MKHLVVMSKVPALASSDDPAMQKANVGVVMGIINMFGLGVVIGLVLQALKQFGGLTQL